MAKKGLRTLALAQKKVDTDELSSEDAIEQELTILGIVGIIDPPRPEVSQAIKLSNQAGIKVIMITGDSGLTALAIAKNIGLDTSHFVTGTDIEKFNDKELLAAIDRKSVFARVSPEHKMRIVGLLQKQGETVAMTGDGVNDAPALKKANVGVAMGQRGTDVARAASDMILTDDNFASIINAVEEGRRQYDNIKKFVRYLLSSNFGEVLVIFINIIIGGPLIFIPAQILWMNLATDSLTALSLGLEPVQKDLMQKKPRKQNESLIDRHGLLTIVSLGGYMGFSTLWIYYYYISLGGSYEASAQTVAFTAIIIMEALNVLNFRSLNLSLNQIGLWSNPILWWAVIVIIFMQFAAVYIPFFQRAFHTAPLTFYDWVLIFIISIPIVIIPEFYKRVKGRPKNIRVLKSS